MADTKTSGAGLRQSQYLARLGTFTDVEIKALALAGLVLMDGINAGRLVAFDTSDANQLEQIVGMIDAGYVLQNAIHSAAYEELPGAMQLFAEAAECEVRHG
jgi:hypothetical protein